MGGREGLFFIVKPLPNVKSMHMYHKCKSNRLVKNFTKKYEPLNFELSKREQELNYAMTKSHSDISCAICPTPAGQAQYKMLI